MIAPSCENGSELRGESDADALRVFPKRGTRADSAGALVGAVSVVNGRSLLTNGAS